MSFNNLLVVGLGNPGVEYQKTRHNVGSDFVRFLSHNLDISLKKEEKFSCSYGCKQLEEIKIHLSIPTVYVNESGQTISRIKKYLKLSLEEILIVHDELDLPTGKLKLKGSGGHGGHNGLKNIIDHLQGKTSFKRLRIGISRPGKDQDVTNYVLSRSSKKERDILENAMLNGLPIINKITQEGWEQAVMDLHTEEGS